MSRRKRTAPRKDTRQYSTPIAYTSCPESDAIAVGDTFLHSHVLHYRDRQHFTATMYRATFAPLTDAERVMLDDTTTHDATHAILTARDNASTIVWGRECILMPTRDGWAIRETGRPVSFSRRRAPLARVIAHAEPARVTLGVKIAHEPDTAIAVPDIIENPRGHARAMLALRATLSRFEEESAKRIAEWETANACSW
jgi:hypothetical protein